LNWLSVEEDTIFDQVDPVIRILLDAAVELDAADSDPESRFRSRTEAGFGQNPVKSL